MGNEGIYSVDSECVYQIVQSSRTESFAGVPRVRSNEGIYSVGSESVYQIV